MTCIIMLTSVIINNMSEIKWINEMMKSVGIDTVRAPLIDDTIDTHSLNEWYQLKTSSHTDPYNQLNLHTITASENINDYPAFMASCLKGKKNKNKHDYNALHDFGYDASSPIIPELQAVFSIMKKIANKPWTMPIVSKINLKTIDDYLTISGSSFSQLAGQCSVFASSHDNSDNNANNAKFNKWVKDMNDGYMLSPEEYFIISELVEDTLGDDWNRKMDNDTRTNLLRMVSKCYNIYNLINFNNDTILNKIIHNNDYKNTIKTIIAKVDDNKKWSIISNIISKGESSGILALACILSDNDKNDLQALLANNIESAITFADNNELNMELVSESKQSFMHDIIISRFNLYRKCNDNINIYNAMKTHDDTVMSADAKLAFSVAASKLGMIQKDMTSTISKVVYGDSSSLGIIDKKRLDVLHRILDDLVIDNTDEARDCFTELCGIAIAGTSWYNYSHNSYNFITTLNGFEQGYENHLNTIDICRRLKTMRASIKDSFINMTASSDTSIICFNKWMQHAYIDYPAEFIIEAIKTENPEIFMDN